MIRAIAAIDDKRGIAKDGDIPWSIPEDKQYYRQKTEQHPILMGKDTYDGFVQPLPNRRNIVVSRSLESVREGFEIIHDVDKFLQHQNEDVWIIGGAGLYASTFQYCDELYLTHVSGDFSCDRFFPEYDGYTLRDKSEMREQNGNDFYYAVYIKNR